jgi:hypothetical protein
MQEDFFGDGFLNTNINFLNSKTTIQDGFFFLNQFFLYSRNQWSNY